MEVRNEDRIVVLTCWPSLIICRDLSLSNLSTLIAHGMYSYKLDERVLDPITYITVHKSTLNIVGDIADTGIYGTVSNIIS